MTEDIKENLQKGLHAIPKNEYQDSFQKWQRCWEWCNERGGEYFEGDKAN